MIMTVVRGKKSLQIPVPAVAVIQEGQALFVVIGRKGYVNCFFNYYKSLGSILRASNFVK